MCCARIKELADSTQSKLLRIELFCWYKRAKKSVIASVQLGSVADRLYLRGCSLLVGTSNFLHFTAVELCLQASCVNTLWRRVARRYFLNTLPLYLAISWSTGAHHIRWLLLNPLYLTSNSCKRGFTSRLRLVYWSTLKTANDLPIFASYLHCYCFSRLIGLLPVTWLSHIDSLGFLYILCFSLTKGQCSKR